MPGLEEAPRPAGPNTTDAVVGSALALAVLIFTAALGAGLAGASLGVDPTSLDPGQDPVFDQHLYAWSLPLQALFIAGLVWTLLSRFTEPVGRLLGLGRGRNWWAVALVVPAGICADWAVALARGWLPGAEVGSLGELSDVAAAPGVLGVVLVLGLVVLGPASEELLFRGLVQGGLQRDRGPWSGILLSALLFGLFHLDPVHVAGAAALGLYLGWLRAFSGSLWPVVVAHVVNNGLWVWLVRSGRGGAEIPAAGEVLCLALLVLVGVVTRDAVGRPTG